VSRCATGPTAAVPEVNSPLDSSPTPNTREKEYAIPAA
jgi:hypothetical protein